MQQKIDSVLAVLQQAVQDFSPVCFANSLGAEDMVLTHMIATNRLNISMFSLDTGRLPQETYDLMQEVGERYGIPLKIYFPESDAVERYIEQHGANGFYNSVEARKACCFVRKVEPLRRALRGKRAWVTGMRRDQAVTRGTLEVSAYDVELGLQKFNPLLDWSNNDVWAYIRRYDVPYNKLHDQFYPSLGCAPCTRSITPGEDIRAGRWWWENPENKECGLHVKHTPQIAHGFGVAAKPHSGSDSGDIGSGHIAVNPERHQRATKARQIVRERRVLAKHHVGNEAGNVSSLSLANKGYDPDGKHSPQAVHESEVLAEDNLGSPRQDAKNDVPFMLLNQFF